jgi:phosphoserine/homoserine phosphotransferase
MAFASGVAPLVDLSPDFVLYSTRLNESNLISGLDCAGMDIRLPPILATDLEGIFLPEIWIAVAERTGIRQLRLTTRDMADYDELMKMRLRILREHKLTIDDIQAAIALMDPLPGATEFLAWARSHVPLIIITDSYYELVAPFLPKLDYATVFAHSLVVDGDGVITGYRLRVVESKRKTLQSFRALGFRTMAVGDSYNDVGMLQEADRGVLFRPPPNVCAEFPDFAVTDNYDQLREQVSLFITDTAPA